MLQKRTENKKKQFSFRRLRCAENEKLEKCTKDSINLKTGKKGAPEGENASALVNVQRMCAIQRTGQQANPKCHRKLGKKSCQYKNLKLFN